MDKNKSNRNKTIDFSIEAGKHFLERCLQSKTIKTFSTQEIIDKTIIGDTFETIQKLPDNFVDLAIIDPPYNLEKNYHGNVFKSTKDTDYAEYTKLWIEALLPKLKQNASLYICCDWKSSLVIGPVLDSLAIVRNRITWQREKGRGAKANWKNGMEDIWFATISEEYTFNVDAVKVRKKVIAPYTVDGVPKDWEKTDEGNFRNTYPSNFWADITIPYWSMPENTAHPTQKSEKLLAKLILASSNKGDVIFDPFSGSGSTLVTAKKLDRHYVGIEQNELYCAWTEHRLELAETEKRIQGFEDGIFHDRGYISSSQRP